MKPEFHNDYVSKKIDPLAPTMQEDFAWDDLYEQFGEQSDRQASDEQMEQLTEFVRKLFQWVIAIDMNNPNAQMLIGRRFIALAWVLNPAMFEGSPSASKLAETLGIKRKADLWTLTGEASRHFGITNRGQSHAWNRADNTSSRVKATSQVEHEVQPQVEPDVVKESFNRSHLKEVL